MPRRCQVCTHPQRKHIDALIGLGMHTMKVIANDFGLSYDSIKRHNQGGHVGAVPVAKKDRKSKGTPLFESPVETFQKAFLMDPMPHQVAYLEETRDTLVLKGRQIGMSHAASALAIHVARSKANATAIIISPSQQQSKELTVRARGGLYELDESLKQDSSSLLRLENNSRILSLPGTDRSVRGYSADLVIVDEAAWVKDETWVATQPITSATGGRTIVQSTPGHPIGFFFQLADDTPDDWARFVVKSEEAATVKQSFLERKRSEMTPSEFAQEYEAEFASPESFAKWFTDDEFKARVDDRFAAIKSPPLGG